MRRLAIEKHENVNHALMKISMALRFLSQLNLLIERFRVAFTANGKCYN